MKRTRALSGSIRAPSVAGTGQPRDRDPLDGRERGKIEAISPMPEEGRNADRRRREPPCPPAQERDQDRPDRAQTGGNDEEGCRRTVHDLTPPSWPTATASSRDRAEPRAGSPRAPLCSCRRPYRSVSAGSRGARPAPRSPSAMYRRRTEREGWCVDGSRPCGPRVRLVARAGASTVSPGLRAEIDGIDQQDPVRRMPADDVEIVLGDLAGEDHRGRAGSDESRATWSPAASSPRSSLPIPMMTPPLMSGSPRTATRAP